MYSYDKEMKGWKLGRKERDQTPSTISLAGSTKLCTQREAVADERFDRRQETGDRLRLLGSGLLSGGKGRRGHGRGRGRELAVALAWLLRKMASGGHVSVCR